jgi:hypothetical protein
MTTFASDHLDRYLRAIGLLLPRRERDDILRELRANLEAELEDRAVESGAPLNDDELIAFLRSHGEPAAVAARFQPQSYLIGPAMWPYFWLGAKLLFIVVAVTASIQALVAVAGRPDAWQLTLLPYLWLRAFVHLAFPVLGSWMLLMALAERGWASRKGAAEWDPRRMDKEGITVLLEGWGRHVRRGGADLADRLGDWRWPDGGFSSKSADGTSAAADCRTSAFQGAADAKSSPSTPPASKCEPTFAKAFVEFFGAIVALVVWIIFFRFEFILTGGAPTNLSAASVWAANYSYVMTLLMAQIGVTLLPLFRPRSRFIWHAAKSLCNVISISILFPFLHATALVVIGPAGDGVKDLSMIGEQINRWAYLGLWISIFCTAIAAVVHLGKALMDRVSNIRVKVT